MNIVADTHCHTIASTHAYSTILELVAEAKKKNLIAIAITDHATMMPGAPQKWHFSCLRNLPHIINGVLVLRGAEVNILDYDGAIDLEPHVLGKLNWVIASYHTPCCEPGSIGQNTRGWLSVLENAYVRVLGHMGAESYAFDHEKVIKKLKETDKVLEINSHSFTARRGSAENCRDIALLCKKYGQPVVVSSDAHFALEVGEFSHALAMLREIDFPEELVLNADKDRFLAYFEKVSGLKFDL